MTNSITFNDQSQSLIQAGTVFQTQFAWASDVSTGTVVLGQSAQITSNSLDNRAFVSNHGKDHAQYDANNGGQIRINDQIMSTIAGDLVTTTALTGTSINYAGQSQLIADGKLDAAETGQTGDYHLEDRTRYRIQDTESIQSLWSNGAWTETGHNFTVDHEAHDAWVYNQTVNLPKNSDPIITNNPDGSTSSQIIRLGQDQSTVTSAGGYDYHLTQSGSPTDFVFSLNHTSQSQSGKHDTGTWQAADGSSGATYDNLGSETKNSRANLSGRVQNGSVYYTGIDVYQTRNTSTDNTGSGFALGSTTSSHTVGSTQTTETRGGNSGSWYGSKLESGNSTTNYTTVTGTMGQPFSGMTQTGFYTTTLYGTAAQTGITGMYGSYDQTGTGGTTYGTLSVGNTIAPPEPLDLPQDNTLTIDQLIAQGKFNFDDIYKPVTKEERVKIKIRNIDRLMSEAKSQNNFFFRNYRSPEDKQRDEILGTLNLENIHTSLDIAGMAPVAGEIFDGLNGTIYLIEGEYIEAGFCFGGMVPGWGNAVTVGKYGKKIGKLENAALANPIQTKNFAKISDGIIDPTNLENGIHRIAPRTRFPTKPGGTGAAYNEATGQGVYVLKNPKTGQIEYIGRGDAPQRLLEHAKPGSGKEDLVGEILFNNNLPSAQAQSLENELMHMLGGPKSINPGTSLRNKIQGIGEGNPNFLQLEFAACDDLVIEALRRAGLLGR